MSEPNDGDEYEEDEGPTNPFDNPYFIPVGLFLFALWFGYDGWFNPNIKSVMFNRVCFPIALSLSLFLGYRAYRESRASRGEDGD